jgi:tellurite resistance protein TehA-like permease
MGTGILAITSWFYSPYLPFLATVGKWLAVFNLFLFFLLLVPWLYRWAVFTKEALDDFKHPIISNFYPTIAVGMLVIAGSMVVIFHKFQ